MKKFTLLLLLTLFCLPSWADVDIDSDNFPNSAFRTYIKNNFDTNKDDILDDDEIEAVTAIPKGFTYTVSNDNDKIVIQKSSYSYPSKIIDFTGIDYFENLQVFACENSNLTELDLSYNENLVALFCSGNKFTEELDVSYNDSLQYLECDNSGLTELSLPDSLIYLSCNSNDLTEISISSGNSSLKYLYFSGNKVDDASYFLPDGTALEHIWCANNLLPELDVSKNTALKVLHCENNQIVELDLSTNTAIETLVSNPQIIADQELSDGSEEDYPYEFDLSDLIYYGSAENVTNVRAFASNNTDVYTYRNTAEYPEIVQFAATPARMLYDYQTGQSGKVLEVTVQFKTPDDPAPTPTGIQINESNFPDSNFRTYISNNFDSNHNGYLSDTEIENVTAIPAGFSVTVNSDGSVTPNYPSTLTNVENLKGISNFTSLINLGIDSNKITSLDLSSNSELEALFCKGNGLTELNLSANNSLKYLDCSTNNLETLDLSGNLSLEFLNCSSNLLSTLDLSYNDSLNYANVASQVIEDKKALTATEDTTYPWEFDFSDLVDDASAITSVTATNASGDSVSVSFNAGTDGIAQFASQPAEAVYNYSTGFSSTTMDVTVSFSSSPTPPPAPTGIEINTANFPDETFRNYVKTNFDTNSDGFLSSSEIANVTSIPVGYTFTPSSVSKSDVNKTTATGLENVKDFTGLENFTSLVTLAADNNSLSALDVSKNTRLETLVCNNNKISELNVSANTLLKYLKCGSNSLSNIDLSKNTALVYLDCSENSFSNFSVSSNTALEYLYLQSNDLSTVNLSANTALKYLDLSSNKIKEIDLSANTALVTVSASSQTISSQFVNPTEDSTSPFEFYFASIYSSDVSKVSNVQAYDSSNNAVNTTYSDGVAKFASKPSKVTYDYDTGNSSYKLNISFGVTAVPVIITTSLPEGKVGTTYSATLQSDTSGSLIWRVSNGNLPDGLFLDSSTGAISGTPSVAGSFGFSVTVSNGEILSSAKSFTLVISSSVEEDVAPKIITANLTGGRAGVDYSAALSATGTTPITWSVTSGNLPGGLSVTPAGIISGRPTAEGTFTFTVMAENKIGADSKELTITISRTSDVSKPSITTGTTLTNAIINESYRVVIYADGTTPITFTKSEGTLPPGLTLNASGVITGTPTSIGTYLFTVKAVNSIGSESKQFSLFVTEDPSSGSAPSITTLNELGTIKEKEPYNLTLEATGKTPITWSLESGRFPDGLTLNSNGTITGAPIATGEFTFKVKATNSLGSDSKLFRLTVEAESSEEPTPEPEPVNPAPFLITDGNRKLSSLTTEEKNTATENNMIIAAILDEVKVNVSGTYSFDVTLNNNAPVGYELVWFSFPRRTNASVKETADTNVYFTDLNGNELTAVSSDKHIKAFAYLTPNVYGPVISAKAPATPTEPEDPEPQNNKSSSGGGGGCNSGMFSVIMLITTSGIFLKKLFLK